MNSRAVGRRWLRACQIVSVGKRRDGGTRYWCLKHKADATAKYGRRATHCRAHDLPEIREQEIFDLRLDRFPGGVALWGAVPAVYDTTRDRMDRGIHLHARRSRSSHKEIDGTFRAVRISGRPGSPKHTVSDVDAIYYMVTAVLGGNMEFVKCTECGYPHLDKDWFSVHPHRRHLCAGCGRHFRDSVTAIGNPIIAIRESCRLKPRDPKPARKKLNIRQRDFPGGLQIWGSNPAFIWTRSFREEAGIHVHAFKRLGGRRIIDDTFKEVVIDGVRLDQTMVRVLMAQETLPHLRGRIAVLQCRCGNALFDTGTGAFTPTSRHICRRCKRVVRSRRRLKNVVANPLRGQLDQLAAMAPRQPQRHRLELLPETPFQTLLA